MSEDQNENQKENQEVKKINELEKQLAEAEEKRLFALADLENFRKRAILEKKIAMDQASANILSSLAELIDDFERMVQDLEKPNEEDQIDAFKPVLDKAKGILVDNGLERLDVKEGDKFNPEIMDAISTTNAEDDKNKNTVVYISQAGYKYTESGRVLRHAKVIVAK